MWTVIAVVLGAVAIYVLYQLLNSEPEPESPTTPKPDGKQKKQKKEKKADKKDKKPEPKKGKAKNIPIMDDDDSEDEKVKYVFSPTKAKKENKTVDATPLTKRQLQRQLKSGFTQVQTKKGRTMTAEEKEKRQLAKEAEAAEEARIKEERKKRDQDRQEERERREKAKQEKEEKEREEAEAGGEDAAAQAKLSAAQRSNNAIKALLDRQKEDRDKKLRKKTEVRCVVKRYTPQVQAGEANWQPAAEPAADAADPTEFPSLHES